MIKLLFQKRSLIWDYDNRHFRRNTRVFYWLKTFICIVFHLYKDGSYYDAIAMLAWNYRAGNWEYGGQDWDELAVGEGVFRNWYCIIYSNGYP